MAQDPSSSLGRAIIFGRANRKFRVPTHRQRACRRRHCLGRPPARTCLPASKTCRPDRPSHSAAQATISFIRPWKTGCRRVASRLPAMCVRMHRRSSLEVRTAREAARRAGPERPSILIQGVQSTLVPHRWQGPGCMSLPGGATDDPRSSGNRQLAHKCSTAVNIHLRPRYFLVPGE